MNPGVAPGEAAPGGWLTRPAPAKLNLFLHVTGRRPDGYHELQTLFELIDLHDSVSVRPRRDGRIRLTDPICGVPPEADLCVRAARALLDTAAASERRPPGVDIRVVKRIPMGAGLGGGSSDAATVLLALNELWSLGLSTDELAAVGVGLGADVPVFVHGRSAWGEGIGDRLSPVALPPAWYLVVTPPCHVVTAEVFASPALTRDTPKLKIRDFLRDGPSASGWPLVDVARLLESTRNDCEPVVLARYAPVADALARLAGHGPARMTGTGASVFCRFSRREAASAAAQALPESWRHFVARGVAETSGPSGHWGVAKR